jgi:hypothetical protein
MNLSDHESPKENLKRVFLNRDSIIKTILWIIYLFILINFIIKDSLDTWELILTLLLSSVFYGFFEHFFLKMVNRIFKK